MSRSLPVSPNSSLHWCGSSRACVLFGQGATPFPIATHPRGSNVPSLLRLPLPPPITKIRTGGSSSSSFGISFSANDRTNGDVLYCILRRPTRHWVRSPHRPRMRVPRHAWPRDSKVPLLVVGVFLFCCTHRRKVVCCRNRKGIVPTAAEDRRGIYVLIKVALLIATILLPEFIIFAAIVVVEKGLFKVGNYCQRCVSRFERELNRPDSRIPLHGPRNRILCHRIVLNLL